MEAEEAELLSSFLMPMMHFYPEARASAAEMVNHPWLKGVVVLGEEEMAQQASMREIEVERLRALRSQSQSQNSSAAASSSNTARNSTSSQGQPAGPPAQAQAQGENEHTESNGSNGGANSSSSSSAKKALEEVMKLGPSVKGMVGMGRI